MNPLAPFLFMDNETKTDVAQLPNPEAATAATNPVNPEMGTDTAIDGATSRALEQHGNDNPPKRGRGRPPGTKKKPTTFTLENDLAAEGYQVGQIPPAMGASEIPVAAPAPLLDEKSIEILVEGFVAMMDELGANLAGIIARKKTGSIEFEKLAVEKCRMGKHTAEMIKLGAKGCAKKYALQCQYAPEVALLGGVALYVGSIATRLKSLG